MPLREEFTFEQAKFFAEEGSPTVIIEAVKKGKLEVPESTQRQLIGHAFFVAAERNNKTDAQLGQFKDRIFQRGEAVSKPGSLSSRWIVKGLEISWNPEGKDLKDQLDL